MASKRFEYLDFIKGVAILLVIYCHQVIIPDDSVLGAISMIWVFSTVPCFMMCSGYVLLFRRESPRRSLKRALHVYVGMVVWKALYWLYYVMLGTVEPDVSGLIPYLFLFHPISGIETEHLWFLQAYLPALLLTPLFAPMFTERRFGMAAGFLLLTYFSNQFVMTGTLMLEFFSALLGIKLGDLSLLTNVLPVGGEYSSMLTCYLMGGMFRLLEEKGITRKKWYLPLAALLVVLGTIGDMYVRFLQMRSIQWQGKLMVAGYEWSSTLIMSMGVFALLRSIGETRPARWLGRHVGRFSMGVYYLHYPCLMLLVVYVYPHLPTQLWLNVAKTLAVAAVCVAATRLLKRVPLVRNLMQ